jgi:hypothetical protein
MGRFMGGYLQGGLSTAVLPTPWIPHALRLCVDQPQRDILPILFEFKSLNDLSFGIQMNGNLMKELKTF